MADDNVNVKFGADTSGLEAAESALNDVSGALAKEAEVIKQTSKALDAMNKELAEYDLLAEKGKLSTDQLAAAHVQVRQRFVETSAQIEKAVVSGEKFVSTGQRAAGKLNLMRQGADVFTTAAMGMNPAMIAIQQGPQILDALFTSGIKLSPMLLGVGAAVGILAGAVVGLGVAWTQGEASDLAYTKAVSGLGRTAGLTADQLKVLVETSAAASDQSIKAARDEAEAYLSTGRIGGEVLGGLIDITKDYASFTGQDAKDATTSLAKAMEDPEKAGKEMTRTFGLLTQEELKQIDAAMRAGDQAKAQEILLGALDKAVSGHAENVGAITNAWDAVANSISNAITKFGEWLYQTEGEKLQSLINYRADMEQRGGPRNNLERRIYDQYGQRAQGIVNERNTRNADAAERARQAQINQRNQILADNTPTARRGPSAETLAARARRAAEDALRDELSLLDTQKAAAENNFAEQMRLQDLKLTRLRAFYGEDSREYQGALQEQLRMTQAHTAELAQIAQRNLQARTAAAAAALQAETDAARIGLEADLAAIGAEQDAGRLNDVQALVRRQAVNDQLLALDAAHEQRTFLLERGALLAQLEIEGLKPPAIDAINRQIELLDAQHQNRLVVQRATANAKQRGDAAATAQAIQNRWTGIVGPIGNSLSGGLTQWATGLQTFEQAWAGLGSALLGMVDQWVAEMITKWLAQEAARVAASVAGAAAREGISATSSLVMIGHAAAVAAARAWEAMVGIPFVGPIIAPLAAAAALAGVLALGSKIFSAERGVGAVANDGDMYSLHRDEMVLPADISRPLRATLSNASPLSSMWGGAGEAGGAGGRRGGDVNIQALDARSVARVFRKHGPAIVAALQGQYRDFNFNPDMP